MAWRRGFPWKLASCCLCPNQLAFFWIFYVLGSYFRTLAVILVSDFCTFWSLLYCCTGVHRLSAGEVRHQTRPSERHVSDLAAGCRCLWPSVHRVATHQDQWPPLRGQLHLRRLATTATTGWRQRELDDADGGPECWKPRLCRSMQSSSYIEREKNVTVIKIKKTNAWSK